MAKRLGERDGDPALPVVIDNSDGRGLAVGGGRRGVGRAVGPSEDLPVISDLAVAGEHVDFVRGIIRNVHGPVLEHAVVIPVHIRDEFALGLDAEALGEGAAEGVNARLGLAA